VHFFTPVYICFARLESPLVWERSEHFLFFDLFALQNNRKRQGSSSSNITSVLRKVWLSSKTWLYTTKLFVKASVKELYLNIH
jgi:hypothetical protein